MRPFCLLLLLLASASQAFTAGAGQPAAPPIRVLFIGNSLTAVNHLPKMVEGLAVATGTPAAQIRCEAVTRNDFSLEDHLADGAAVTAIRRGGWSHIVLQQGPSSLPESQEELRASTARLADEGRRVGATIVLYGVWPPRPRLFALPAVTSGYARAAADVGGRLAPAGEAWRRAWEVEPKLPLYGADDFHPSPAGTFAAASVLVEVLTGRSPKGLTPDAMRRQPALRDVELTERELLVVQQAASAALRELPATREIAITIDDLPTASRLGDDFGRAEQTTTALLAAIRKAGVPAIGFVNERKLQPDGELEERRVALLRRWFDAGLDLGNHTFSHPDLHRVDVAVFESEIERGDQVLRRIAPGRRKSPWYFRHPFLHTGRSKEVRDRVHAFLEKRGYQVAPVTIDNYDYLFAAAYDLSLASGDTARAKQVADEYVRYMDAVVEYYEQQSVKILGRMMKQTLLIHANAVNAVTLERLVGTLRARGYRFITLPEALEDPAYRSKDEYFGPAGMTWLHRWAITAGVKADVFKGEPVVPRWIEEAAAAR